jgi:hypothetical protein
MIGTPCEVPDPKNTTEKDMATPTASTKNVAWQVKAANQR